MSTVNTATTLCSSLANVTVDPDPASFRAWVDGREIEAESTRQLRRLLANALYEELHTGRPPEDSPPPFRVRDLDYEQQLANVVPHPETITQAQLHKVVADADQAPSAALVTLEGLKVWVPYDRLRVTGQPTVGELVTVANDPRRPALSPGFFLVQGTRPHRSRTLLRTYVHIVDPRHTASLWGQVLELLESAQVAYRAKVLSNPTLYPRRDSLVVYLDPAHAGFAHRIAEVADGAPGTAAETSCFTQRLAAGVAIAWEPADDRPGMSGLSFGQHRATVVAEALIEAAHTGQPLEELLRAELRAANIDPDDVSRNRDSAPVLPLVPA